MRGLDQYIYNVLDVVMESVSLSAKFKTIDQRRHLIFWPIQVHLLLPTGPLGIVSCTHQSSQGVRISAMYGVKVLINSDEILWSVINWEATPTLLATLPWNTKCIPQSRYSNTYATITYIPDPNYTQTIYWPWYYLKYILHFPIISLDLFRFIPCSRFILTMQ